MKKILLTILFTTSFLIGGQLKVGDSIKTINYKNQFEQNITITKDTKKLIIAFSKDNGEAIKSHIEKHPNYLQTTNSVYFADVSGAPKFIMNMFMLPKIQKYTFSMILLEDEKSKEQFPQKDDLITIITLENLKIKAIEFKSNIQ